MTKKPKDDFIQHEIDSIKNEVQKVENEIEALKIGIERLKETKQEITNTKQKEKEKVMIAIYDCLSKEVTDQVDLNVPSTNNLTEVCDFCNEDFNCGTCVIEFLKENKHCI